MFFKIGTFLLHTSYIVVRSRITLPILSESATPTYGTSRLFFKDWLFDSLADVPSHTGLSLVCQIVTPCFPLSVMRRRKRRTCRKGQVRLFLIQDFNKSSTERTVEADRFSASCSSAVSSSSYTCSTPFPPRMTGTPKYISSYPYSPSR